MSFIVGLFGLWFAWKLLLTVATFIWGIAEGIDYELEDRKGHILRPYRGPMMREIQPKKEKRLFDKR